MLSKLQGKKPWGYMRISPWAWPVLNICFWINEAERKGDGAWGYELGFGLWASHWISLGISFRFYKVRQLGWICLLAQKCDDPWFTRPSSSLWFCCRFFQPQPIKTCPKPIRFWESLKVLMPLSRVAPNPGLSTSHSLCLSWNISMLEISNNLIHLRFRVEKRNTIEIN